MEVIFDIHVVTIKKTLIIMSNIFKNDWVYKLNIWQEHYAKIIWGYLRTWQYEIPEVKMIC